MNGPEHYREAEKLIAAVHRQDTYTSPATPLLLAQAQVHATLALAAATAGQLADQYVGDGDHITDWARTANLGAPMPEIGGDQ